MRDVVDSGRVAVTDDALQAMQRHRSHLRLRGHAIRGERQPGPGRHPAPRRADRHGARAPSGNFTPSSSARRCSQALSKRRSSPSSSAPAASKSGVDFGLAFQPEFLREGSSIRDYDHPPYTIVGGNCEAAVNAVREIFQHLDARFLVTSIRVAEALKMSCNAFHALKITFANEIGRVSQALGIDRTK